MNQQILYSNQNPIREAVGIFTNSRQLEEAVHELQIDFPHHALSVLGHEQHIKETLGMNYPSHKNTINNSQVSRNAPIHPEEKNIATGSAIGISAYIGAVAAALAAGAVSMPLTISVAAIAGVSSGGAAAILVKILGDKFNKDIEEKINEGGLFLWVNTPTPAEEEMACNILRKNGAIYVEAHSIQ